MAGIANTFENDIMKLFFQATAVADLAENDASSPATNLYASLHATYPGEAGDQTTGEVAYTSYARAAVARTSGGWTVTNNVVNPVANISFPTCTGAPTTAFFFGIGVASSGAGKLLFFGGIGPDPVPFQATASDDTVRAPGQVFVVDDRLAFYKAEGASLPTGITEGTVYWVKSVTGSNITISTSQGGSTLDITADGSGAVQKLVGIAITASPIVTPLLGTATTIKLD